MTEVRFAAGEPPARIVERLMELERAASEREVTVRLESTAHPRPGAVVALLAWMNSGGSPARTVRCAPQSDEAAIQDVLPLLLPAVGAKTPMREGSPGASGCIHDLRAAREQAELAVLELERRVPRLSPSVLRSLRFVYEELGANIVQHSDRPTSGFGRVAFDEQAERLELAFADRGIGFLSSLRREPELQTSVLDDADALQWALAPRLPGARWAGGRLGIGLKWLVTFADQLDGDLWIASGSAVLRRRTLAGLRSNTIRSNVTWRGTWIALEATPRQERDSR